VGHGRVAEPLRTFSGLKTVHSSTADNPANIPTWTFYGSTYTSKYITFTSVEETTNVLASGGKSYTPLQTPTADQTALMRSTTRRARSRSLTSATSTRRRGTCPCCSRRNLSGDWTKIASDLKNPSSSNAKSVLAAANFTTERRSPVLDRRRARRRPAWMLAAADRGEVRRGEDRLGVRGRRVLQVAGDLRQSPLRFVGCSMGRSPSASTCCRSQ